MNRKANSISKSMTTTSWKNKLNLAREVVALEVADVVDKADPTMIVMMATERNGPRFRLGTKPSLA